MIICNETVKVSTSIVTGWLQWLKEEHIPGIINTGCFTHATILHLLEADDKEGITYAVQYHAENKKLYDHYISHFEKAIQKKVSIKWGDQLIYFRTIMQVVN